MDKQTNTQTRTQQNCPKRIEYINRHREYSGRQQHKILTICKTKTADAQTRRQASNENRSTEAKQTQSTKQNKQARIQKRNQANKTNNTNKANKQATK